MNIHGRNCKRSNGGFTLIEVMIALAVLTIGLTGMAAMQLSAMQYSHSSHYRSLASTIALNFEEQLWLELADNDFSCASDWAGKISELQTNWNRVYLKEAQGQEGDADYEAASGQLLRVPRMRIELIDDDLPVAVNSVVTIPIRLQWDEFRFGDTGEGTNESFDYTLRIQCTSA